MKLYDFTNAPNPRRVRIFLAEKGLTVPTVQVDLGTREQLSPAFREINPRCTVPALVLDDGTAIADVLGICRYVEEIRPDPPLMGTSAADKAIVTMWERRMETEGQTAAGEALRNSFPGLKGRALVGPRDYEQIPAVAERSRARLLAFYEDLDTRLAEVPFVAGDSFTIADITAIVAIDFATGRAQVPLPDGLPVLRRWRETVAARPSMTA